MNTDVFLVVASLHPKNNVTVRSNDQKYVCVHRRTFLMPYLLFSRNTITFHNIIFWCSLFCEFCSRRYCLKQEKRYKYHSKYETRHGWTKLKKTETNCNFFSDHGTCRPWAMSNFSFETKLLKINHAWLWGKKDDYTQSTMKTFESTHLNWACCCTNWKDCQYHMPRLEHCSTQTEALTWLKLNFSFILNTLLQNYAYIPW